MQRYAMLSLLISLVTAVPALAAETMLTAGAPAGTAEISAAQTLVAITDFSAAKRKPRAVVVAPSSAPAGGGWQGADPSKGPGIEQLRALQRAGVCVIDEGYGRYTYCSNE